MNNQACPVCWHALGHYEECPKLRPELCPELLPPTTSPSTDGGAVVTGDSKAADPETGKP